LDLQCYHVVFCKPLDWIVNARRPEWTGRIKMTHSSDTACELISLSRSLVFSVPTRTAYTLDATRRIAKQLESGVHPNTFDTADLTQHNATSFGPLVSHQNLEFW
jgi:hypothetical protein